MHMRESALARTWLFINYILEDYEKLNMAREQYFAKWHCAANQILPASTGIQGRMTGDDALAFEFCAFSGDNVTIKQISSPLQNEPTSYGKLFSRAVAVEFPHSKLLLISGTAAVDKAGSSVYIGNSNSIYVGDHICYFKSGQGKFFQCGSGNRLSQEKERHGCLFADT